MADYVYFDKKGYCSSCPLLTKRGGYYVCEGGDSGFRDPTLYMSGSVASASVDLANMRNLKFYQDCVSDDPCNACDGPWRSCSTFQSNLSKMESAEWEKQRSSFSSSSSSNGNSGDKAKKTGGGIGGVLIFLAILFILFYMWKNNII